MFLYIPHTWVGVTCVSYVFYKQNNQLPYPSKKNWKTCCPDELLCESGSWFIDKSVHVYVFSRYDSYKHLLCIFPFLFHTGIYSALMYFQQLLIFWIIDTHTKLKYHFQIKTKSNENISSGKKNCLCENVLLILKELLLIWSLTLAKLLRVAAFFFLTFHWCKQNLLRLNNL